MNQKRVLAVDDEPRYLRLMRVNLETAGYRFVGAGSADEALEILATEPPDVLLLDVRMAGKDGFAALCELRDFSDVPVIFVTAAGEEADKVRGLKLGADDYMVKPFGALELLARVEAVMRRYQGSTTISEPRVRLGSVEVDLAQRRVFRDATEVRVSRTEFRLLSCLIRQRDKVVPQDELVRQVWGSGYDADFEGLRVYVYRLRHKLENDPDQPELLITFPGIGYMLRSVVPVGV
jgi:DNA-binding response OmpR family regulator